MAIYALTGSAALSASATTILWGVVSGSANADASLTWADITFNSASPAQGILVQLFRATGGIPTLTSYTANRGSADAQQTASNMAANCWVTPITATPTGQVVVDQWYVNPAAGVSLQWPLGREDYMLPGSTVWTGMQVVTPSGVSPSVAYNAKWNE
jgi:hypothetical protein